MTDPDITNFDLQNLPAGFVENPFPWYKAFLEKAPICWQPDGSVLLSRYDDLDRIYRDTSLYLSDKKRQFGPKYGVPSPLFEHHTTSLVFNDPPLHTRVRKIMAAALNARAIQAMEPGLIEVVDQLLDNMAAAGEVDLVEDFASRIPIQIIGNLFAIPVEERGPLRDWSLAILGALEPSLTDAQLATGHQAVKEFKTYLKGLVAERRKNPGDPAIDVLTRLIESEEGQLSEVELLQNCIFILNAGHETTTNLIGNAIMALLEWPGELQRLRDTPEMITTAVDEFLRYASPNQFGNRETAAAVALDGQIIPKGTNIHLCMGAANRDPSKFDQPDRLQLDRKPNKHLAFAGGPHLCVGFSLARLEGRVAVSRFLNRFRKWELIGEAEISPRIRFRGYTRLPMQLTPF